MRLLLGVFVIGAVLSAGTALAVPIPCTDGTVASYLGAPPCSYYSFSTSYALQMTGYSTTFGVPSDQTPVLVGNFDPFLRIGNGTGTDWVGPGNFSIQMQFNLPQLGPGFYYGIAEDVNNGSGLILGFGGPTSFTGGVLNTGYTVVTEPGGVVQAYWSYSYGSVYKSGQTEPVTVLPPNSLEQVEVYYPIVGGSAPTPEPSTALLSGLGLFGLVRVRRLLRR